MRKLLVALLLLLLFMSCEKPYDCVKSSGPLKSRVIDGLVFSRILVNKRINLVVLEGPERKVEIVTGENLIGDIEVEVSGDLLRLTDNTSCNWVRDYGATVVYVTAPNITQIISKTEQEIRSQGVLHYPSLHLLSLNDLDGYDGVGTGDFHLEVDNASLQAENNDLGRYFISGHTENLRVYFWESGGVFHGENLYADTVHFFHRGSNDLFIRPINSLSGDIYNIGDVNCFSRPPANQVQVTEHYRGRLIYR